MDLFLVKKALAALVLPPTGPLVVAAIGLTLQRSRPRLGRSLAWAGVLLLTALSLPVVSQALLRALDSGPPIDLAQASTAQAIVILGGGVRRAAPEYGGDTLGRLTLERVRYGARLARKTGLPVLVTGGVVYGGTPEAVLMKQALESEFGIPVKWEEAKSRNTRENALNSAAMLRAADIHRVILVAHGFDMRRAKAEFVAAGLEVIAAPTGIPSAGYDSPLELLPSAAALQGSYYALYELLANAVRGIALWTPKLL
jgi:uncharacterized SAM-binding protein YcdF (DUF218 family)